MTTPIAESSVPPGALPDLPDPEAARRAGHDAFVERLLRSAAGAFDMFTIHIGDQLGLYAALAVADGLTPRELAARTGTHERYVREWLEQQTVSGILTVDDAGAPAEARRYRLPEAHAEALTDTESLDFLAPLAQSIAGAVRPLRYVLDAFRDGSGVPYGAYGAEFREGQARMNRALLLHRLGQAWLPAIPDVHARLLSDPPAHVADIGCGAGWSSIGIARAYPRVRVDGIDLDAPSVELARANAEAYGVADRVRFEARDAADARLAGRYDLVLAVETVHDMSDPIAVLTAMRRLAAPDAAVLVVDERVGDAFTAGGSDFEWLMYGWSVLHCLPVGMAEQPSAGTGTVMRTEQLRGYARAAGFADVEVLPIEHPLFRVYRLAR